MAGEERERGEIPNSQHPEQMDGGSSVPNARHKHIDNVVGANAQRRGADRQKAAQMHRGRRKHVTKMRQKQTKPRRSHKAQTQSKRPEAQRRQTKRGAKSQKRGANTQKNDAHTQKRDAKSQKRGADTNNDVQRDRNNTQNTETAQTERRDWGAGRGSHSAGEKNESNF